MFIDKLKQRIARITEQKKHKPIVDTQKDMALVRHVHNKKFPAWRQWRRLTSILSGKERLVFRLSVIVLLISVVWGGNIVLDRYRVRVPAVGGNYTEAIIGSPEHITPLFASLNDVDRDISRLVYSGLMRYDEKQRLVPDLAVGQPEMSEDKLTYVFTLREDVTWHDGEPFTAHDVVFTIETIQDPDVGSPLRVSFDGVLVEAIDDHTVSFTLPEVFTPFLSSLTVGILPKHIWLDIPAERVALAKENLQPIGTGPYMLDGFSKDDTGFVFQYDLKRFAEYYRTPPFIEEFSFRFFSEYDGPTGAIAALREQKVQGLHFVPYDLREKVERKFITLHTLQLPQYTALFFNSKAQSVLEDNDVRIALTQALDKQRIARDSLRSEGQVIHSPVLPGFPGYSPSIQSPVHSIDEANSLLDKEWERVPVDQYRAERKAEFLAAWDEANTVATSTDDTAGSTSSTPETVAESADLAEARLAAEIEFDAQLDAALNPAQTFFRTNDDGELLEVTITTAQTQQYERAAKLTAGYWQEIGVKTTIEFISPKEIEREALKDRAYDVLLYGAIIGGDPDQYPFWHSSQKQFPGLNLAAYENRDVDALLEQARETTDEAALIDLYITFQETLLADRPAVFLFMPTYTYATVHDVHGIGVSRIFNPSDRFSGVTQWYIKTKKKWNFDRKQ